MEELLNMLKKLRPSVSFTEDTDLIAGRVLDSITTVELTALLEEAYDIEFTPLDIVPANFRTPKTILALVERKLDE